MSPLSDDSVPEASLHRRLPTLLSQVLIAFTIEFDNEAERQGLELTSRPWLVSLVMWANFLQYVGEDGISLREIQKLSRDSENSILSRSKALERWRYIVVEPDPDDTRSLPPRWDWMVQFTSSGKKARKIWLPLLELIEKRWEERFGAEKIDNLRRSLGVIVGQLDGGLPDYLPVVGNMYGRVGQLEGARLLNRPRDTAAELGLSVLLSQTLLSFAMDVEREFELPLPIAANVLRVLAEIGLPVRDLPALTGISKEAVSMSLSALQTHGYVVVESDPNVARTKLAQLTLKGKTAQEKYFRLIEEMEARWRKRFGDEEIDRLCGSLQALFDQWDDGKSALSEGLVPDPRCWRARKPYLAQTQSMLRDPAKALSHYPAVLHRGGFPDGS